MPTKSVQEVLPLPPKRTTPVMDSGLESPLRPRVPAQAKLAKPLPPDSKEKFTYAACSTYDSNATDKNDKRLYCAFFPLKGGCQKGDKCVFSHNIPEAHLREPSRIISLPTKCNSQIKGGECRNGPYCPYMHSRAPAEYESLSAATTTMSGRTSSAGSSPEQSLRQAMIDSPQGGRSVNDVAVIDDLDEFPILGATGIGQKQKTVVAMRYSPESEVVTMRSPPEIVVAPPMDPPRPLSDFSHLQDEYYESGPPSLLRTPPPMCPMWGYQVTAAPLPEAPPNEVEEALADEDIHFALGCLDDLIADPPLAHGDAAAFDDELNEPTLAQDMTIAVAETKESEAEPRTAPEDAPLETATFLVDTRPKAEGYLKACRGEMVIILHNEDEWFYGVISGDGDRLGWFAKRDVA